MPGTLFIVATPIGNLEDITLRALRVLREVDLIAAEDTRRTAKLLAHYSIASPTLSFHEHNTRTRIPELLARLDGGADVAIVTDAGTPGISDPGSELIRMCAERGIAIDPLPGACAPVTAAVASGFRLDPLTILGFIPARAKDRSTWVLRARDVHGTFTCFETPHRIRKTLADAGTMFGNRPIFVAREMTKIHQEFMHGSGPDIIGRMTSVKGEFTLVVGPGDDDREDPTELNETSIYAEFGCMTVSEPGSRRQLVSALAKRHGVSTKEIYDLIERQKVMSYDK
ncbi:MAG: 16S rRNA (cytidine(1402)-2'-O)-methyltransferase [Acidobacteria bacterium]|nr:16S rRNA (cytidine(1402)-2'-O)-methyltransferase [Acidobacteriota bacterium]